MDQMPIINRIANFAEEMKQWRQELHSNPELKFDCYETAEFIVKRLKEFGIKAKSQGDQVTFCLLYTSPSPRDS